MEWILSFWVYILQSRSTGRFYCGHTSDLDRRLAQHNDPDYRLSRTTKILQGPWEVVWTGEYPERGKAMVLEKKIKKRGISRFLKDAQSVESR